MAVGLAFLSNDETMVEEHVASAADKVYGAVYLGVLEIMLALLAVAVIGVLIGQHAYALKDCTIALVLPADGTACRAGVIVVEVVLQSQILHIGVDAAIKEHRRGANALFLHRRTVADDGSFHALSYQCHIMSPDGGEHGLSKVVDTVGYEDEEPLRHGIGIHHARPTDGIQETLGIASLYHDVAFAGVQGNGNGQQA